MATALPMKLVSERHSLMKRSTPRIITLAATLAVVPEVPVAGMALILGVDRFMSECRSLTNFIGNAVATVVVSRWENGVDMAQLNATLDGKHSAHTTAESSGYATHTLGAAPAAHA